MATVKNSTNYRLQIHQLDRSRSFHYRSPDLPHQRSLFTLEYSAYDTHVTVRVPAMSAHHSDAAGRHMYELDLSANHYNHRAAEAALDPTATSIADPDTEYFQSVLIDGCVAEKTELTFRVPISTVRSLSAISTVQTAQYCPMHGGPYTGTAPQCISATFDLHPPQLLSIVPDAERHAFHLPPVYGELLCHLQLVEDFALNTIEFRLTVDSRPERPYECDDLRVRLITSTTHQSGWMRLHEPQPISEQLRELLATGQDKMYALRNFAMLSVARAPGRLFLADSTAEQLADNYSALADDQLHEKDVTVVVGPQRVVVRCYRALLISESMRLRHMLLTVYPMDNRPYVVADDGSITIQLPDEQPAMWQHWVAFMYTGRVEATGSEAFDLLSWASSYGIEQLQRSCAMTIVRDTGGIGDYLQTVYAVWKLYDCEELRFLLFAPTPDMAHMCYHRLMVNNEMGGASPALSMRNMYRRLQYLGDHSLFISWTGTSGVNQEKGMLRFQMDGHWFGVHEFVLRLRAPLFAERMAAMAGCRDVMPDGETVLLMDDGTEVNCPECSVDDMQLLLRHIYAGDMLGSSHYPVHIWQLAQFFGLPELAASAQTFLMMRLMEMETYMYTMAQIVEIMQGADMLQRYAREWVELPKPAVVSMDYEWLPAGERLPSSGDKEQSCIGGESTVSEDDDAMGAELANEADWDSYTDTDTEMASDMEGPDAASSVVWAASSDVPAAHTFPVSVVAAFDSGEESDFSSDLSNNTNDSDFDEIYSVKEVKDVLVVNDALNQLNAMWKAVTGAESPVGENFSATVTRDYVFLSMTDSDVGE